MGGGGGGRGDGAGVGGGGGGGGGGEGGGPMYTCRSYHHIYNGLLHVYLIIK